MHEGSKPLLAQHTRLSVTHCSTAIEGEDRQLQLMQSGWADVLGHVVLILLRENHESRVHCRGRSALAELLRDLVNTLPDELPPRVTDLFGANAKIARARARWNHAARSLLKITFADSAARWVDLELVVLAIDLRERAPHGVHHRLLADRGNVRSCAADKSLGETSAECFWRRPRPTLCVNRQDFGALLRLGQSEAQLAIEPSRAAKAWVNSVRAIRCTNHDDLATALETVHQCQQSRNN
jgi:hypothetical protein